MGGRWPLAPYALPFPMLKQPSPDGSEWGITVGEGQPSLGAPLPTGTAQGLRELTLTSVCSLSGYGKLVIKM